MNLLSESSRRFEVSAARIPFDAWIPPGLSFYRADWLELFFSTVEIFLSSFTFRLCRRYVAVCRWTMKICMVIISVLVYCIICEISKQIKMELIPSSVDVFPVLCNLYFFIKILENRYLCTIISFLMAENIYFRIYRNRNMKPNK